MEIKGTLDLLSVFTSFAAVRKVGWQTRKGKCHEIAVHVRPKVP